MTYSRTEDRDMERFYALRPAWDCTAPRARGRVALDEVVQAVLLEAGAEVRVGELPEPRRGHGHAALREWTPPLFRRSVPSSPTSSFAHG